jgi:cytochrome c oxidase subunit III
MAGKHFYHLVDPSPWPLVAALAAFIAAGGAVLWLNPGDAGFGVLAGMPFGALAGAVLVLAVMVGWWRDVIVESARDKRHTPVVKLSLHYGALLALIADALLFAGFLWAFLAPRLAAHGPHPAVSWAGVWIVLSGAAVLAFLRRFAGGKITAHGLIVLLLLSVAFGAVIALTRAPPSAVLVFLRLHAAAAVVFLAIGYVRVLTGSADPGTSFGIKAAVWFWQFTGAAWLAYVAGLCFLVIGG